jgi:hypothetical protein
VRVDQAVVCYDCEEGARGEEGADVCVDEGGSFGEDTVAVFESAEVGVEDDGVFAGGGGVVDVELGC